MIKKLGTEEYLKKEFTNISIELFKQRALCWSKRYSIQCFLDHNAYHHSKEKVADGILAVEAIDSFIYTKTGNGDGFEELENWLAEKKDWAFGFLSYDLKNEVENLRTYSPDFHAFPLIHFFRPGILIFFSKDAVIIQSKSKSPYDIFQEIQHTFLSLEQDASVVNVKPNFSKEEYLQRIKTIKEHIQLGDIYEMNFCQSYTAQQVKLDPLLTFQALNNLSAAPFSSYYQLEEKYLFCGSPERFLKKAGQRLLSQPIKGTRPRRADASLDQLEIEDLLHSQKDKSENVMIVDLVRNDLARSCVPGSIQVEELFGIYTFKAVHQMISTISGQLRQEVSGLQAIRNAFPMGSMTGAPKIRAMQLIDQYERNARGLYSGSVGYFTPGRDFDFNVVIRSILYEADRERLSFQVGGAIVADSIPEEEFEECMVKASTMMQVLGYEAFVLDTK